MIDIAGRGRPARRARATSLLTLEAMKMELPIRAPARGHRLGDPLRVGELVQPGMPLVELA